MKIFIFLNDCLIGENTTMELLFAYIKNKSFSDIKKLLGAKNKKEFLNSHYELLNFNNLFLRQEVVTWLHNNTGDNTKEDRKLYIVSDLPHVPVELLNLGANNGVISYEVYGKEEKSEESTIIITGELWCNYRAFFHCKKLLFVGPLLVGKLVNMFTVGRTEIIHRSYGIFTIIWEYFINFFATLDVLWLLLFFLPSTNFNFWIKCFIITSIFSGIFTLWRHFLELEVERKHLVDGEEILMGGNFIYLHYSTGMAFILSIILLVSTCIFSVMDFKVLIYSLLYSMSYFLFLTRSFKEKIWGKIFTLLILTTIVEPTWLGEMIKIKFNL